MENLDLPACDKLKISGKTVCIGDLRHRIKIQKRTQVARSVTTIVDYEETFEDLFSFYAALETSRGYSSFGGVGINTEVRSGVAYTHKFYIRYSQSCLPTSENWVEFNCDKYKIIDVENLGEMNRFLALRCVKKGSKSINGNLA